MTDKPDLTERQEQILAALMAEWLAAEINPTEKGVLADDELGRQLGMTEEEVRHDVAELADRGLIEREGTPMTQPTESELAQAERHADYAHKQWLIASTQAWRTDAREAWLRHRPPDPAAPYHDVDLAGAHVAQAGAVLRAQLCGSDTHPGDANETYDRLCDAASQLVEALSRMRIRASADPTVAALGMFMMTDQQRTPGWVENGTEACCDDGWLVPAYDEDGTPILRDGRVAYVLTPLGLDAHAPANPADPGFSAEVYAGLQEMLDRALAFDAKTRERFAKLGPREQR
jgi:hypothetical protein